MRTPFDQAFNFGGKTLSEVSAFRSQRLGSGATREQSKEMRL